MEISRDGIEEYIKEYGIGESIKAFAELMDKRVYFAIKGFNVTRKKMNMAIPAAAYIDFKGEKKSLLIEAFQESIDAVERQHISKIDRLSNLTVEKLVEKLEKIMWKDSTEHALRYAKELLLRDEDAFYKLMGKFALLDDISSGKALFLSAFKKLARKDDEIIFLLISYMIKARGDYSNYERVLQSSLLGNDSNKICETENLQDLKTTVLKKVETFSKEYKTSEVFKTRDFFNLITYLDLLLKVENLYKKEEINIIYQIISINIQKNFENKLNFKCEANSSKLVSEKLTPVEETILSEILLHIKFN